jgi:hypothetical protein
MLPANLRSGRRYPTDQEVLDVVQAARAQALASLDWFKRTIEEVREPGQLSDLHHWLAALEGAVARMIRDRKIKLAACQMLSEARLRIERELGAWLRDHVDHSGGGDRRTVSPRGTPLRDLPDGITRNESSKFQKLASISDIHFEHWLVTCRDKGIEITTKGALKLAKALARERQEGPRFQSAEGAAHDLQELVASGQRFGCLYVDPPWEYGNTISNGAAANHYPTQTLQELAALPVKDLAAAAAHIHLWTTTVHLPAALDLLTAWGLSTSPSLYG